MAAVATRERSSSTRKPFGWIQRLYKRNPANDVSAGGEDGLMLTSSLSAAAPFLGIGDAVDEGFAGNDMSSLRPTISTRAPSVAYSTISTAAVRNVDAISSPITESHGEGATSRDAKPRSVDIVLPPPPIHTAPGSSSGHYSDGYCPTPLSDHQALHSAENPHHQTGQHQYPASVLSSKESCAPSIFTTKTSDTQPTISHLTHAASLLSSRTGAGHGATDNASMLTLASSSRGLHRRRLSTDTNCSVRALAPASARASFESSRTGVTDTRRTGVPNSSSASAGAGHSSLTDDSAGVGNSGAGAGAGVSGPGRPQARYHGDGSSVRRSLGGV